MNKGFTDLSCPLCGSINSIISLQLDDCETLSCSECEEEFTVTDIRVKVMSWAKFITWIDNANKELKE